MSAKKAQQTFMKRAFQCVEGEIITTFNYIPTITKYEILI